MIAFVTDARDFDGISSWYFIIPGILIVGGIGLESHRLRGDLFSFFNVFLVISGAMFLVTAFLQELIPNLIPVTTTTYYNGYVNYGILTYVLSVLFIATAYHLPITEKLGNALPSLKEKSAPPLTLFWIVFFLSSEALALYLFIWRYGDYTSFYMGLEDARLGFGMFLLLIQIGGCAPPLLLAYCFYHRNWKIFLAFLPFIWICFVNPSRAYWFSVLGAGLIYYHTMRKRVSPAILAVALLLFVPLALYIGQMRNEIALGGSVSILPADEQAEVAGVELQNFNNYLLVLENYPRQFPYYYGQLWLDIPIWFVPRQIWPQKPTVLTVLRIQEALRGLGWEQTSYTYLSEFYANFGLAGIIGGSLLTGLIMGLVDNFHHRHREHFKWVLLYGWVLFPLTLFFTRLGFIAIFANLLSVVPLAVAIFLPIGRRRFRTPALSQGISESPTVGRGKLAPAGIPSKGRLG